MPIILDDFKLSNTVMSISQICEIVAAAESEYGTQFLRQNQKGTPGLPELRLTKSYHAASQTYSNHATMKQPKVYRTKTKDGMLTPKRLVVVPSPINTGRWQSYLVDVDPRGPYPFKFVNIGPKNGAITECYSTTSPSWKYKRGRANSTAPDQFMCVQTLNVRVNEGTGVVNLIDHPVPSLDREWVTPEETMRMFMRLVNYSEPDGNIDYSKLLISFLPVRQDADERPPTIRWRTLELWNKEFPEMTIDLNRPDFPLNEQDRVFVSLL